MPDLARRLTNLETRVGDRAPRFIAVGSGGATSEEIDAFLAGQSIDYDPRVDEVVHLELVDSGRPIELFSITTRPTS